MSAAAATAASAPAAAPAAAQPEQENEEEEEEEEAMLRGVPCCRCLQAMASWRVGKPIIQCVESNSASSKCSRCASMKGGKVCVPATRQTTAAALRLKSVMAELADEADPATMFREEKDEILAAQLAARKALQVKKNLVSHPEKRKEMDEEADMLLRERAAAAAEDLVRATKRLAKAQEQTTKVLAQVVGLLSSSAEATKSLASDISSAKEMYQKVNIDALSAPSEQENDEEEEDESVGVA